MTPGQTDVTPPERAARLTTLLLLFLWLITALWTSAGPLMTPDPAPWLSAGLRRLLPVAVTLSSLMVALTVPRAMILTSQLRWRVLFWLSLAVASLHLSALTVRALQWMTGHG
ncbi:hypothetical protein [Deinococcus multiflagellatus]|uniref:Uncharacterized protein n=1 Tax=Deinococcus multiflagellatus TaxID=1656887 RepID=A0ABW1ZP33_9DEIO|nr:hypothetical protein [Deinococcus multiflagellatus]MBZ9715621.1 hypothetical protein [Deinococcus multiflagellatus]